MPRAALRPCLHPGCRALARAPRCPAHAEARALVRRKETSVYLSPEWRQARARFLIAHPLCWCGAQASVVDHVRPHRGSSTLFWDVGNWQALCPSHHSAKTATSDGGFGRG